MCAYRSVRIQLRSELYALTTDTNTAPYAYSMRRVLYDFLVTVKAAPHECVIRTGQP